MIIVPQFETLEVKNYGLFPGKSCENKIGIEFKHGLTLLVGINGLGKTTLLTMLLRMISGPFDITTDGAPSRYEAILPSEPKRLKSEVIDFFSQRVADGATEATAKLTIKFGGSQVSISRNLATLALLDFASPIHDAEEVKQDTSESTYQSAMADLFNLSSFVDVLFLLHNLIFFTERRAGALWDANAQRHVLSAIVLNKDLSKKFASSSRAVQTADSQFRNTRAQYNKYNKQLNELAVKEEASPVIRAELEATVAAIAGHDERLETLEGELSDVAERHRSRKLELEKAKLEQESANGLIERAKYTSLLHSFPKMDDAARLLLARILSEEECLVCGADAVGKKAELERLLMEGFCPACGSKPEEQVNNSDAGKFEQVKMEAARKKAQLASKELEKSLIAFEKADLERSKLLDNVVAIRSELSSLKNSQENLNAMLPSGSQRVDGLKKMVAGFKETMNAERATLEKATRDYSRLLGFATTEIEKSAAKLSEQFGRHIQSLLSEQAVLTSRPGKAKIGQESTSAFDFPVFVPQMTAADRPGLTERQSADDVSESQRELIDLAFRLAMIEVAAEGGDATFVMETPEVSLDGIAMKRVGETLGSFAASNNKRLVLTNNLTNAGMMTAIFGGPARTKKEREKRFSQVFNLLEEAAPNQALEENRMAYGRLLEEAVLGGPG